MKFNTRRPIGIGVLMVYLGLYGLYMLYVFGQALLLRRADSLTLLLYALPALAFSLGAWTLKPWGWLVCLVSIGVGTLVFLAYLLGGQSGQLMNTLFYAMIVIYLLLPGLRHAFGRK